MEKGGRKATLFLLKIIMLDCLETVVGITTSECPCVDDPANPENLDVSLSGYFIDDMELSPPLVYPANALECGDDNVFEMMIKARTEGINEFFTDLLASISKYNTDRYNSWSGQIGETKKNVPLTSLLDTYIGVKIEPWDIRGAVLRLNGFSLQLDADWTGDVLVLDQFFNVLHTENVSVLAGDLTSVSLSEPLKLPFYVDDVRQTYYIVYDRAGAKPYNIKFDCGCGGHASYKPYRDFININGIYMPALAESNQGKTSSYTEGLVLNASLTCDAMDWICFRDEEYQSDPYARVVAKTIQLYSIKKLIAYILNSSKINRFTLLNREHLYGKRNHIASQIDSRLGWLAGNLPKHAEGCLQCKAGQSMVTKSILV